MVQGVLHAHVLVAPQPDQARHSPAQASARPWVTQQALRSRPRSSLSTTLGAVCQTHAVTKSRIESQVSEELTAGTQ